MPKLKFTLDGGPVEHHVDDTATVQLNCGPKAASAAVVGDYLLHGLTYHEITAIE